MWPIAVGLIGAMLVAAAVGFFRSCAAWDPPGWRGRVPWPMVPHITTIMICHPHTSWTRLRDTRWTCNQSHSPVEGASMGARWAWDSEGTRGSRPWPAIILQSWVTTLMSWSRVPSRLTKRISLWICIWIININLVISKIITYTYAN